MAIIAIMPGIIKFLTTEYGWTIYTHIFCALLILGVYYQGYFSGKCAVYDEQTKKMIERSGEL